MGIVCAIFVFACLVDIWAAKMKHHHRLGMSIQHTPSEKKIIFIRHGTTEMNEALSRHPWGSKNFKDANLWDTRLSKAGQYGSKNTIRWLSANQFQALSKVEVLVSSPLTRALQTSELMLTGFWDPPIPWVLQPLARERLFLTSDVGRTKQSLQADFSTLWDFNLVPEGPWWFVKDDLNGTYSEWRPPGTYFCEGEPEDVFKARMVEFKSWLLARPEHSIAVVSHWGVIKALTGFSLENCEIKICRDCDLREHPLTDI